MAAAPGGPPPAAVVRNYFKHFATHAGPIAILSDLDGTLVPLVERPQDTVVPSSTLELLENLAALPRTVVAIVSGRLCSDMDKLFAHAADARVYLIAEHGAWIRSRSSRAWTPLMPEDTLGCDGSELDELQEALQQLSAGTTLERKRWGLSFHSRTLPAESRAHVVEAVIERASNWLASQPQYELIRGNEIVEVRLKTVRKSLALSWARTMLEGQRPSARLLVMGDDITDEDMFRACSASQDISVLVGARSKTQAHYRLCADDGCAFLGWLYIMRKIDPDRLFERMPVPIDPTLRVHKRFRLLIVSNRLPAPEVRATIAAPL
jgi:trehalose 6-phosphate phosphatase